MRRVERRVRGSFVGGRRDYIRSGPCLAGEIEYGVLGLRCVGLRVEFNVDGETILTTPIFNPSICPMTLDRIALDASA